MPVVPHEKGPARDLYSMTVLLRFGIHQDEVSRLFVLEAQLRIPEGLKMLLLQVALSIRTSHAFSTCVIPKWLW